MRNTFLTPNFSSWQTVDNYESQDSPKTGIVGPSSNGATPVGISNPDFSDLVPGVDYAPDEVIVKFKSGANSTSLLNALEISGDAALRETTQTLGIQLWGLDGISVKDAIALYSQDPSIEYIEPNYRISVEQTPNDPSFSELWGLHNTGQLGGTPDADIDAPEAWDIQTGDGSVIVGVIDTGVDYTHSDLMNNIWTNSGETPGNDIDDDSNGFVDDYYGWDFAYDDSDPFDGDGHGTHVSGTIAAEGDNGIGVVGVNWDAQIMPIKFLDDFGYGSNFDAIQSVEYAILMGADLTNNSWGGGGYSQGLYDAIAAAGAAGQLFIAAAGNDYGNNNDIYPHYPSSYDLDNIIAVAATDRYDDLSDFSNYGPTSVDLGAPGSEIYSTIPDGGYAYYDGTSMATPHVSGVAALVWAEYPDLTAAEVKEILLETTDPIPALEGLTVSGGRLNAYNALIGDVPIPNPAEIHGKVWSDINGDGEPNTGEPGLRNWIVYLDENQNGQLDPGEVSTQTNIYGHYAFTDLAPSTYAVAEVMQPSWHQTCPAFLNSGFEMGDFTGWQILGNTNIETNSFGSGPTEGIYQALATSGSGSVSDTVIENFLELAPGSLDGLGNGNATSGSAIARSVTVSAGDQVSFDWNFLTNDYLPYNDFAFVSIAPESIDTLADLNSGLVSSPTIFYEETGFDTFSYTFPTDGTFTLGVGVVDVADTAVDSGVLVDNFVFTGEVSSHHMVELTSGEIAGDIDFGNHQSESPTTIYLTKGDDVETIVDSPVIVYALRGNDLVDGSGSEGGNRFYGGHDDDILIGNFCDQLFGGPGSDEITVAGGAGKNTLFGEGGNDTLRAGINDALNGGPGDDILYAGQQDTTMTGAQGNDQFWITEGDLPGTPHAIADFEDTFDKLGVGGFNESNVNILESDRGTLIQIAGIDTAILTGVSADLIDTNDFIFA
jgi:subtilisin family serine protease